MTDPAQPRSGLDAFRPDCRMPAVIRPAVNVEPRKTGPTDILLLHYTGLPNAEQSIQLLASAESRVSCHYVVDLDGRITQMVPERLRAWHAGQSVWAGETDINSRSIGIEIQNTGHPADGIGPPPPFPASQIRAVIALGLDIVERNGIAARRVLAHSDIAPNRKIDPGEGFPWADLARAGLGVWVEPEPISASPLTGGPGDGGLYVDIAQRHLANWGYGLAITGAMDPQTTAVVTAFQRHFRPSLVDGRLDLSTLITLERLCWTHLPDGTAHPSVPYGS
jgi:N-acetylmuramoyl-L-alanine amidase